MEKYRKAEAAPQGERDAKLVKTIKPLTARSQTQRRSDSEEDIEDEDQETIEGDNGQLCARKNCRICRLRTRDALGGELESFGIAFRDADMVHLPLETQRLAVERDRVEMARIDCENGRELEREERNAQHKLELKNAR